jgi:thiamine-phosphate pyrophosphorylase
MQLCAITDRRGATQPLLSLVEAWSTGGVDFIQLREKDLSPAALQALAREVVSKIDRRRSKLLVNISTLEAAEFALAAGADGVHLAGKPRPGAASSVRKAFRSGNPILSVPCHSLEDIDVASREQVDLMLFSPVFEKVSAERLAEPAQGLEGLRLACAAARGIPVLALGGVTTGNALDCVAVGAAGIAGIRLFAGDDWRRLRNGKPS